MLDHLRDALRRLAEPPAVLLHQRDHAPGFRDLGVSALGRQRRDCLDQGSGLLLPVGCLAAVPKQQQAHHFGRDLHATLALAVDARERLLDERARLRKLPQLQQNLAELGQQRQA